MSVQSFKELANNKVLGLPDGNIFSWCPTMDLLAISMNQTSIWMFRVDGERVYSINNKAPILDFQWSLGGKYFVCSGNDKAAKVYDSNTGANLGSFDTHASECITLISWHSFSNQFSDYVSNTPKLSLDLSQIDILKALPKLSFETEVLDPQHGLHASKKVEASSCLYTKENNREIDYILVVNDNEFISVIFRNTFIVPNIPIPKGFRYVKHIVGKDFFKQNFLLRNSNDDIMIQQCKFSLSHEQSKINFIKVLELMVQMIAIQNHINEQCDIITKTASDFLSLFDRYLSNYRDSLLGNDGNTGFKSLVAIHDTIVIDLSDMLLTGLIPQKTQDFWLNQFGVRGLTRLSSVGNAAYDTTRELLYAQVLLAAQKLIIILSDLEGLAKAEQHCLRIPFGLSTIGIKQAIEQLKEFVKDVHDFIWSLNEEQELMNKFLNWCEIEVIEKLSKNESDPADFFKGHPILDFSVSLIIEYFDGSILNPVFLKKCHINCGDNEVLKREHSKEDQMSFQFDGAGVELKNLRTGLEKFIAGAFIFEDPQSLQINGSGSSIDSASIDEKLLVLATENNNLTFASIHQGAFRKKVLSLPGSIITGKILGPNRILVLYKVDNDFYQLDEVEFMWSQEDHGSRKMQSMTYTADSFTPNPAFVAINTIANKSHTVGIVVDGTKKKYSVLEI